MTFAAYSQYINGLYINNMLHGLVQYALCISEAFDILYELV